MFCLSLYCLYCSYIFITMIDCPKFLGKQLSFYGVDNFLDASEHLYKRLCPSVGRSVMHSVTHSHSFFILHSVTHSHSFFILHSSFGNAILQKEDASIGHTWPCFSTSAYSFVNWLSLCNSLSSFSMYGSSFFSNGEEDCEVIFCLVLKPIKNEYWSVLLK